MQHEYLARLSAQVQNFILEVEERAGLKINVISDPNLNAGGPFGQGELAVVIKAQQIRLFAPTNGYFPDGGVRHEVLHVQRFHIEGVPKLTLADSAAWDKGFDDALGHLDNAIEHIIIVPIELQLHPERRAHWEAVMRNVCSSLPEVPSEERRLAVCLHWTFLRHVLPGSPPYGTAKQFAKKHALLDLADEFADQFLAAADRKEEIVRLLFSRFPEIPRKRAALEYINSVTGTRQKPIP